MFWVKSSECLHCRTVQEYNINMDKLGLIQLANETRLDYQSKVISETDYHKVLVGLTYDFLNVFSDLDSAIELLYQLPADYFQEAAIDAALDDPEFKTLLSDLATLFERMGAFGDGLQDMIIEARA